MILKHDNNPAAAQLRWVVLLLAIVVILPTVCLIWFMSQTVKNVRLAARQRLIDFYQLQIEPLQKETDKTYELVTSRWIATLEIEDPNMPFQSLHEKMKSTQFDVPGFVVYDSTGNVEYPVLENVDTEDILPIDQFELAWETEFAQGDPLNAIQLYTQIIAENTDMLIRIKATLAIARCWEKQGEHVNAINNCQMALTQLDRDKSGPHISNTIADANIFLFDIYTETDNSFTVQQAETLLKLARNYSLSLETREVIINKIEDTLRKTDLDLEVLQVKRNHNAERISRKIAEKMSDSSSFDSWPDNTFRRIPGEDHLYGFYHDAGRKKYLVLDSYLTWLRHGKLSSSSTDMYFHDNTGQIAYSRDQIYNPETITQPADFFWSSKLQSKFFPDWKVAFYLTNSDALDQSADKQKMIYIWAGIFVILLILMSGSMAAQAISRQAKLNKLKNNFIATVTHELKTPLASMRMLVDTLLEGRYKDENQVTEYLQLVAKENKRLSRLIDNFLTFSRMERNKHAFEIESANAAAIANEAAEAVRSRFQRANVKFETNIAENIPPVKADSDAMVTVLVNLLDNAFKYSGEGKQISLKVYQQVEYCCFEVTDNGIGMPPRIVKKIFDRFYQADRTLSRTAEGCGLGLSIVKFIVDAHHGKIEVQSQLDKGTTFTVKIPIA